ncbi:MAG: M28 family peptidase [Candidatus Thermoplasmatota archaeon]|jgi:hypothetical protein
MRKMLALLALLLGAAFAGCLDSSDPVDGTDSIVDPTAYVVPAVPAIDAVQLLADHAAFVTQHNERAANLPTHESAREAMLAAFESYGLEAYRQNFTAGDLPQANIMGIKWGVVRDQWVVVGGHYDTITDDCLVSAVPVLNIENPCIGRTLSQGAYDDGSGTMMTLHLAEAFSNITPYYTMAFVAYDGEERGTQGAAAFVNGFVTGGEDQNFTQYGPIKVVGAVDLDMVGINWPGTMAPMNILTNSEKAYSVADEFRSGLAWPDEQWIRKEGLRLGSSDYARFWEVTAEDGGPIPTIFFISDFEEVGITNLQGGVPPAAHSPEGVGAYPFWHLEDTVETMTAMAGGQDALVAGFQSATELAATVLHAMACQPSLEFDAVAK